MSQNRKNGANSTLEMRRKPNKMMTGRAANSPHGDGSLYESQHLDSRVLDGQKDESTTQSYSYLPAIQGVVRSNINGSSNYLS